MSLFSFFSNINASELVEEISIVEELARTDTAEKCLRVIAEGYLNREDFFMNGAVRTIANLYEIDLGHIWNMVQR